MREAPDVLSRRARAPDVSLRYGPLVDHVIDVRLPPADGPRPLVVVVHGGFWRTTYDRMHAGPQSEALADAGYVVATVEYRRVGAHGGGWPETFDDVAQLSDHAPALVAAAIGSDVRPETTILMGHSAGAHLALWAAARHRLPTSSRWHRAAPLAVNGVVSLAGLSDLARADELGLGADATRALLGGSAKAQRERYGLTSPAELLPCGVPTTLVHGARDTVVPIELSRDFVRRAAAAGDRAELVELPHAGHYELIDPLSSAWPAVLRALGDLV